MLANAALKSKKHSKEENDEMEKAYSNFLSFFINNILPTAVDTVLSEDTEPNKKKIKLTDMKEKIIAETEAFVKKVKNINIYLRLIKELNKSVFVFQNLTKENIQFIRIFIDFIFETYKDYTHKEIKNYSKYFFIEQVVKFTFSSFRDEKCYCKWLEDILLFIKQENDDKLLEEMQLYFKDIVKKRSAGIDKFHSLFPAEELVNLCQLILPQVGVLNVLTEREKMLHLQDYILIDGDPEDKEEVRSVLTEEEKYLPEKKITIPKPRQRYILFQKKGFEVHSIFVTLKMDYHLRIENIPPNEKIFEKAKKHFFKEMEKYYYSLSISHHDISKDILLDSNGEKIEEINYLINNKSCIYEKNFEDKTIMFKLDIPFRFTNIQFSVKLQAGSSHVDENDIERRFDVHNKDSSNKYIYASSSIYSNSNGEKIVEPFISESEKFSDLDKYLLEECSGLPNGVLYDDNEYCYSNTIGNGIKIAIYGRKLNNIIPLTLESFAIKTLKDAPVSDKE
ncbi:hypothetical protein ABK040_012294 [Willaertia magna]